VNDSLGHEVGDRLLQQVAVRLQETLWASDTLARLGGDEFAVLVPGSAVGGAVRTAQRLRAALAAPVVIDASSLAVDASIGIALFPVDGADVSTLLRRADIAMYLAKRTGRGHALVGEG
jgi:diguanylate cyclase (GGDEF)-like protein